MKRLKQEQLFDKLKQYKIPMKVYISMYVAYNGKADAQMLKNIPEEYLKDGRLNEKALAILSKIDEIFKVPPKKAIKKDANYLEKIQEFNELFPTGVLPNGKRARATIPELEKKFDWFFANFAYSWATILKATEQYISEYEQQGYFQMRTAKYFVQKNVGGELHCDLANYCEMIGELDVVPERPKFKTNIID